MAALKILALDLGNTSGYAYTSGSGIVSGAWKLHNPRKAIGLRYSRLRNYLDHVQAAVHCLDVIAYEQVIRHRGSRDAQVYGAYQGVVQEWCALFEVKSMPLMWNTIKKHATGSGRANKTEMVAAAKTAWPSFDIVDDNHADALWILSLARQQLACEPSTKQT